MQYDALELEDIKARTTLSSVFARFGVRVSGRGYGYASCPFHLENTPSCFIDDRKGFFYCFGCGEHGDHFGAVMQLAGVNFSEAVRILGGTRKLSLAERERLERSRRAREEQELREQRALRFRLAIAWSEYMPIRDTLAAEYLHGRGLDYSNDWTFDLRFAMLSYRGYESADSDKPTMLGE